MDEWDMLIDYVEWSCNFESDGEAAKESLRETLGMTNKVANITGEPENVDEDVELDEDGEPL